MAEAWKEDFHRAVAKKNADAMRQAIANGLPINKPVLGFNNEFTALHYAIDRGGGPAVVEVLIAAGSDVNVPVIQKREKRQTPLDLAARRGDLPVVQRLLAAGADVNYTDKYDITPLSASTSDKKPAHEAVMKALLAAGTKSNYQALVGAARHGSPAMIEMLAASGADVNEVSRWGTALVLAAHEKRVDTVEALLRVGADPRLRLPDDHPNYPGKTALDVAMNAKASKVIPILEAALAGQRPALPVPRPLDDVRKLWQRIENALKARPAVKKSLNKGATEDQIAACEGALGVTFPDDLRGSYRIHNGQKTGADGLLPEGFADLDCEFVLLRLDEVASEWKTWKDLDDAGEFKKQKAEPDAGVRSDWWNPKWVPFAVDGGGDSLCVDFAPAKGGTAGQVILHQHADKARSKKATSIQALLQLLAEYLEELTAGGE
jgi:cell wall assembly regulator SMI1/ankyrin repeat protein